MTEYLGWAATAVFVGSYFFTRAQAIKRVQMAGALIWTAYGLLIGAAPVVVANLLVFGAAAWSSSSGNPELAAVNQSDTSAPSTPSGPRTARMPFATRK
jgi:hypothetical protein